MSSYKRVDLLSHSSLRTESSVRHSKISSCSHGERDIDSLVHTVLGLNVVVCSMNPDLSTHFTEEEHECVLLIRSCR